MQKSNNMIDEQRYSLNASKDFKRNADFEKLNKLLKIELQAKDKIINEKDRFL